MKNEKQCVLVLLLPPEVLDGLDRLCADSGCTREEMAAEILSRALPPAPPPLDFPRAFSTPVISARPWDTP